MNGTTPALGRVKHDEFSSKLNNRYYRLIRVQDSLTVGLNSKPAIRAIGPEIKKESQMKARNLVAAAVLTLAASNAYAFHDGGVATCDGCHTMHSSKNGVAMGKGDVTNGAKNVYLLQGTDQSSTCLMAGCHAGATMSSKVVFTTGTVKNDPVKVPLNLTPGGDFAWLTLDYTWTNPRAGSSKAERHGHNVIAADLSLTKDLTLTTAPGAGATYLNTELACNSCHDPHGRYRSTDGSQDTQTLGGAPIAGSSSYGAAPVAGDALGTYRLLAGVGYKPASVASTTFTKKAPVAVAPATYNRTEALSDTRVAYGKGMSEWCTNCHTGLDQATVPMGNFRHPASDTATFSDTAPATILTTYNKYVKTGDSSADNTNAYNSLVPFGTQAPAYTDLLAKTTSTAGADASSTVICLSCHRAHATAFPSMSRWNNATEFLTVDGDYADATLAYDANNELTYGNYADGKNKAELTAAYYGRPATKFATFQRSMCNKCHDKD